VCAITVDLFVDVLVYVFEGQAVTRRSPRSTRVVFVSFMRLLFRYCALHSLLFVLVGGL
jgi:hypothetical protein